MTDTRLMAVIGLCALGLSACDRIGMPGSDAPASPAAAPESASEVTADTQAADVSAPAVEEIVRPEATESLAEIDWTTAREDMASAPSDDEPRSFQIATGADAPPVPVLLPKGLVMPAGAAADIRFQPLTDGYFAAYPGAEFDIIVNGTNEVIGEGQASPRSADMLFLETAAGGQISFSRYGADYLVEFECNEISGASGTCIEEAEAVEIANKLIVAGTR